MNGEGSICRQLLVLFVTIAFVVGTPDVASSQEASSGRFIEDDTPPYGRDLQNYVTWNLWQGAHWGGSSVPTDRLQQRVKNSRRYPRAVATQESCIRAFRDLRAELSDIGYNGAFYTSNPNVSTNCERHGNAIFWRGGCAGGFQQCVDAEPFPHQSGDPDEHDNRGWACGRSLQYSAFYCSAHLTNINVDSGDPEYHARLQSIQYRQKSEAVLAWVNIPTVFMGDFNIDYRAYNPGFQAWRVNHREADACDGQINPTGGCFNTFSLGPGEQRDRRYDYIFAAEGPGFCFRADDPSFYFGERNDPAEPVISDHVMIRGYFGCP